MPNIVRIPDDFVILVCDAKKALLLKNTGAIAQPKLQVETSIQLPSETVDLENRAKPGRRFDGGAAAISGSSRSAMETTDPKMKDVEKFAEIVVAALTKRHRKDPMGGLLIVAPPSFLGIIRQKLNEELQKLLRGEVTKELADMPVAEIQKILIGSL